ncbi:MAG: cytochrome c3 family protein [Pyrinomonadaceae bacterium]
MNTGLRLVTVGTAAIFFGAGSFFESTTAQRGRDNFSHSSKSHTKISCSSCHRVPSGNWASSRGYPDVTDYPGHASCLSCHRKDFFSGNPPAICAICHVNPGPRGAARFPFPVRAREQEFSTIFPHNVHQNLIADSRRRTDIAVAHVVPISFTPPDDDEPPVFNSCAVCHKTLSAPPRYTTRKPSSLRPLVTADTFDFKPEAVFFKDSPDNHASCFNCHYQNQKPLRNDCAACHRLRSPYTESKTLARYSLKFDHQSKNHVNKDCISCHLRITQSTDLRSMLNADVPILTCSTSSCHGDELADEIGKRDESVAGKPPIFQCAYCHTPGIGNFEIPASHRSR